MLRESGLAQSNPKCQIADPYLAFGHYEQRQKSLLVAYGREEPGRGCGITGQLFRSVFLSQRHHC